MTVSFGFDVSAIHWVDIEIDDEELEGMSEEEILEYVQEHYESEAEDIAEHECDYSLCGLDAVTFNGEEHWVAN